jgi:hypothetical protein
MKGGTTTKILLDIFFELSQIEILFKEGKKKIIQTYKKKGKKKNNSNNKKKRR